MTAIRIKNPAYQAAALAAVEALLAREHAKEPKRVTVVNSVHTLMCFDIRRARMSLQNGFDVTGYIAYLQNERGASRDNLGRAAVKAAELLREALAGLEDTNELDSDFAGEADEACTMPAPDCR